MDAGSVRPVVRTSTVDVNAVERWWPIYRSRQQVTYRSWYKPRFLDPFDRWR